LTGICREFFERSPFARIRAGNPAADSKACAQIPVTHEQGISRAEQGISGAVARITEFSAGAPQNGVNSCEARDLESCRDPRYFAQPREVARRQSGGRLFVAR
jgi:hypothetical protein